jgi:hypothetical protein
LFRKRMREMQKRERAKKPRKINTATQADTVDYQASEEWLD